MKNKLLNNIKTYGVGALIATTIIYGTNNVNKQQESKEVNKIKENEYVSIVCDNNKYDLIIGDRILSNEKVSFLLDNDNKYQEECSKLEFKEYILTEQEENNINILNNNELINIKFNINENEIKEFSSIESKNVKISYKLNDKYYIYIDGNYYIDVYNISISNYE